LGQLILSVGPKSLSALGLKELVEADELLAADHAGLAGSERQRSAQVLSGAR